MMDQYFGIKELYEVVLRAKTPMQFGKRYLEADEPVLYFENISMSTLSERQNPIMARGGWSNLPHVVWEDRSEVTFRFSEGVSSSISLGILLSAQVGTKGVTEPLYVSKREGPKYLDADGCLELEYWPVSNKKKKSFIFEYDRKVAQKKVYGERVYTRKDPFDENVFLPYIKVYTDKECQHEADNSKQYIVDYYYEYKEEALIYTVQKERFNGLFTLEGKFYAKDETEGLNYTNLLYMPKVRIVSDINLRLGERADPTVSSFNIIGLPENTTDKKGLILEITRLSSDIE